MKNKEEVDYCVGSSIEWTAGSDVTKIKKTKGKGKKKTTVMVKANSFFNFFESINPRVESQGSPEQLEELEQALSESYDLANAIKVDLIPLALEFYLGVVDMDPEEEHSEDGDSVDSEESWEEQDEKPKKKAPKKEAAAPH